MIHPHNASACACVCYSAFGRPGHVQLDAGITADCTARHQTNGSSGGHILNPTWAVLSGAVFLGAALGTAWLVRGIVRIVRQENAPAVATLPLQPEQSLELPSPGRFGIYAWTRRPTSYFTKLKLELRASESGTPVPGSRSWMKENNISLGRRHRVKLWVFEVARPGRYVLHQQGLDPAHLDAETELLVAPSSSDSATMRALVPRILGSVLLVLIGMGALTLGIVVLSKAR